MSAQRSTQAQDAAHLNLTRAELVIVRRQRDSLVRSLMDLRAQIEVEAAQVPRLWELATRIDRAIEVAK